MLSQFSIETLRSAGRRVRFDWPGVVLCVFLLAFPAPGAGRMVVSSGPDGPTTSQEEVREENVAQRRAEESEFFMGGGSRPWMPVPAAQQRRGSAPLPATSAPAKGHRLPNGHNAPLTC